ncbi:MAG: hypothetical protein F9K46_11280, partial [Anaerolineae bacterium]
MAFNIQAYIIDIRHDVPNIHDQFLVDTNVWYWLGYANARVTARPYQLTEYSSYLIAIRQGGAKLHKSALSFSELAHRIESTELEIFQRSAPQNAKVYLKQFRHNYPVARQQVITEITNT